jgi:AraC family transcriptional regulator of adaptative response/methylated-DNA-[protein]-cysteine methyltransferase
MQSKTMPQQESVDIRQLELSRNLSEKHVQEPVFVASMLETPLGTMVAVADRRGLRLLEWTEERSVDNATKRLQFDIGSCIASGHTLAIDVVEHELNEYFAGRLSEWTTQIALQGSAFQISVWHELQNIPYGETRSYADVAGAIGRPHAYRAVAHAIGNNRLAILIPCHRVVRTNGAQGGYNGGLWRKKWLLNHEANSQTPRSLVAKRGFQEI